jgi:hypothetical protein
MIMQIAALAIRSLKDSGDRTLPSFDCKMPIVGHPPHLKDLGAGCHMSQSRTRNAPSQIVEAQLSQL